MRGWTSAAVLAFVGCARLEGLDVTEDGGGSRPVVEAVDPAPGQVPPDAHFQVRFSAPMDQGQLLSEEGRSEAVVLVAQADVERAFTAISRPPVSVEERRLFAPAVARVSADGRTLELVLQNRLDPGPWFLLVAPKLQDRDGRKLQGNGARFGYQVMAAPAPQARLLAPLPGSDAPSNLAFVHASAIAGRISLVDDAGATVAGPVDAQGAVEVALSGARSGARLRLAVDGAPVESEAITISRCPRKRPVSIDAAVAVEDTSADVTIALDVPARIEVEVGAGPDPCGSGCTVTGALVSCAMSACDGTASGCVALLHLEGLSPARDYAARVTARDLQGFVSRGPPLRFSTLAALPRVLISEVMAAPSGPAPRSEGEYVEIMNLGPGSARVETLALGGPDGVLRPLLAVRPPLPLALAPGQRALAVGSSFDPARYPSLPGDTPLLRASTQRLLGHGLSDDPPPALRLVLQAAAPMELSTFPGGGPRCPDGAGLQRDEAAAPEENGPWRCGPPGGTPGLPP